MAKYIILDRDGVLVKDKGYMYKTEDLELMPGVIEGLKMLSSAGYKFIVISNQAGIAKGLYTKRGADKFNNKLKSILASKNINLEEIYYCEHHPDINGSCDCRKPAMGLALKAADEFHINLGQSYFVGDKDSDVELGKKCGGKTCLIDNRQYKTFCKADFQVSNLKEFAEIITMRIKTIIFDFDGVLADSFNAFYPLLRDSAAHVGLNLTRDQYRDLFIGNVHQSLRNFAGNEKKYSALSEFRKNNYDKYYYDKKNRVKLFPGALKFLKKIGGKYILTIASSGQQSNIENLLEENSIKNLFGLILADTAYSKEGMIKEILKKFHTKNREVIMISDTVGDIAAAKEMGLKTIAVTWGFQSENTLKSAAPDRIVKSFSELARTLNVYWVKNA